ncbi:C-type lectin BfL-2-like [Pelodiscus sinensis]|uniref:C-type lectin BfL-2-like n=1 Tax=Pelodiscus sinensis TaxID=13735 RepID=UPI003F6ACD8C
MGPVAFFSLCLLGCLIFNPSLEASPRSLRGLRTGSGINATACPRGWGRYGDHCYGYYHDSVTWLAAEVQCENHHPGAHLASILNDAERDALGQYLSKMTSGDVWIGLHNPCKGKTWVWSDGSRFHYTTWVPNEPNNLGGKEYCGEVYASTGYKNWNDIPCEKKNTFVCKYTPQ